MWTSQVYGHHDKMARTKTHRTSQTRSIQRRNIHKEITNKLVSLFKSFLFPNAFRKRINGFSQLFFIVDYKNIWIYLKPGTGNHWFDHKLTFSRFQHYLSTKCNSYLHVQHCFRHNSETMAPW